ncbi:MULTISPECIES: GspE/PulE family protein [unclassified Curtobacterium]|uniref:GspE/PulE family protein n=1 Tax=unclassified Curtobacterium TaxID=257496 RepID=UPI00052A69AA|nr:MULTISPECIES: ATPase, T2SS/T4P/T4SS family [unclassified Curtobacterium]AIV41096.1 type II secretion system protein E [Curtobacterium sp. MR_MD2014]MCM3522321.1 Flp pilus assembly complex ATPase component TadA [Curtobacterium sp. P97]
MATLSEILILNGALPIEHLDSMTGDEAIDERSIRTLVDQGVVSEAQYITARAASNNAHTVPLTDYPVDGTAVSMLPAALCRRHGVLGVGFEGETLVLAMVNPSNVLAIDDARTASGRSIKPLQVDERDLVSALDRYLRADDELNDLTSSFEDQSAAPTQQQVDLTDGALDDVPIVRFVNLLVSQAIQDHASDIHIEPGEHEVRVRYRIDGVLHEMAPAPKNIQNGVISRLKIMSDIDIAERRKPQDGRMSVRHGGRQIDLRVATLPTVWGEKVVMRILDNTNTSLTLKDLNLLEQNFQAYQRSYSKPYGMILVTGPTGSGKSTTLYTTLNAVAKPEINVITVEDPVEYRMAGINQVQVNPKAGLTFASALRSILRSDPDVVLLGEIRDHETAQIAIEASLTGHLVLSTLHTNDAPSAVTRLTEMDIEPFLVGSALDSVVAQRLARRLCDRCKAPAVYEAEQLHALGFLDRADVAVPEFFAPIGCAVCSNTGYRGRIALHEVMTVTEEIERLAVARASSAEISRVAQQQGMLTLRQDGWEKVKLGMTSVDEILRVVA